MSKRVGIEIEIARVEFGERLQTLKVNDLRFTPLIFQKPPVAEQSERAVYMDRRHAKAVGELRLAHPNVEPVIRLTDHL